MKKLILSLFCTILLTASAFSQVATHVSPIDSQLVRSYAIRANANYTKAKVAVFSTVVVSGIVFTRPTVNFNTGYIILGTGVLAGLYFNPKAEAYAKKVYRLIPSQEGLGITLEF